MGGAELETAEDKRAYKKFLSNGHTKMDIARVLGITKQAVTRWQAVPLKYVKQLSQAYGVSKKDLRPSDFE
jgi:hypothetical protein